MMPCPHCGESVHADWCRENVPLAKRVDVYVGAMLANGVSRGAIWGMLTLEEQIAFARGQ